jgi:hypothetical protein
MESIRDQCVTFSTCYTDWRRVHEKARLVPYAVVMEYLELSIS